MKKKVLVTSILTIALCLCLIAGSTYALFTSEDAVNVAVTAGKLKVVATIDQDLVTRSLEDPATANRQGAFSNGGHAELVDGKTLQISYMTPGDVVEFNIDVDNQSNVALKYRVSASIAQYAANVVNLADALEITVVVTNANGYTAVLDQSTDAFTSGWIDVGVDATNAEHVGNAITSIKVIVEFPNGIANNVYDTDGVTVLQYGDNHYQEATTALTFTVEAVQANGVDAQGNLIQPQ